MAFQVSPGVQVLEVDATSEVPAVSTSIGGFVGSFNWGPVDQVVTVGSEKILAETFGTPDSNTAKYFLTAASFLKYGNALKVVRVLTTHLNATALAGGNGLLIKNDTHYIDQNYDTGAGAVGSWAAKYPGTLGNSLKVSMVTEGITSWSGWTYSDQFTAVPGTSAYADNLGRTSIGDELHVIVVDEDGLFTVHVIQIINGKTEAQEQVDIYNKFGFKGLKEFLVDSVEYKII